ncbi:MAG: type II toxin-antitoxin system death-on-curing family toxin [Proteobacteria bacterium]|jgi:death on curing protein|nr:type II toxin-antitoxin system death-on-curing family toxin [Pseudomonadota bacterium]
MTDYLTIADILAIHENLIERFGGSHGIRDMGALESALFRPQTGYYADLIEEGAALWESLAQYHPFVDGNKRVAFAGMYVFLAANGVTVDSDPLEAYVFINGLYETQTFTFDKLLNWLKAHIGQG